MPEEASFVICALGNLAFHSSKGGVMDSLLLFGVVMFAILIGGLVVYKKSA